MNSVFAANGTLADRFTKSEREGYRDLYAGIVGVFRNVYGHRIVDPTPEDAGAFIVFVNLLLKRLEDLTAVLIRIDPEDDSRRGRTSLPHLRA